MSVDNTQVLSGIKQMRVRMKQTEEKVKEKNDRSAKQEEDTRRYQERYKQAILKQKMLKTKLIESEDKLWVAERKIGEGEKRLYEKEQFLREMKKFVVGESIPEAESVNEELKFKKQIYKENYEKFQRAKQRKMTLESKIELFENKSKDLTSRINTLHSELQEMMKEDERHQRVRRKMSKSSDATKSECERLQSALEMANERQATALQRVDLLAIRVANTESKMRTLAHSRLDKESDIKNILRKVRENMYEDQEEEWL